MSSRKTQVCSSWLLFIVILLISGTDDDYNYDIEHQPSIAELIAAWDETVDEYYEHTEGR
jgi:hypothetical protein